MNDSHANDSFINMDGCLDVRLATGDVSWFDVLWFSRRTPAVRGGWNYKDEDLWRRRGLSVIGSTDATFIQQWTRNSLANQKYNPYLPPPRTKDFKFGNDPSRRLRDHLQAELDASNPAESASENALSYALFRKQCPKIEMLEDINVKGYEIPLAAESSGQLKVDLFGISPAGDAIEIIELKKADNKTDSPLIALTEAICYALQTLRCKEWLKSDQGLNAQEDAFAKIKLTLLAPATYWAYWGAKDLDALRNRFEPIIKHVNDGIGAATIEIATRELKARGTA